MNAQPTPVSPLTVVAIGVLFFGNGLVYASWVPRLPEIREALAISDTALGLTLLGAGVGGLLTSLVSGVVVDRFGSRRVAVAGALFLTVTLPLIAIAPAAWVLFVILVLTGSSDGVADVAVNSQALQIQRRIPRSILTRVHGMWSIGTLAGGLIAAATAFAGIALGVQLTVTAVVMVAVILLVRRHLLPSDSDHTARVEVPHAGEAPVPDPIADGGATGRGGVIAVLIVVGVMAILTELVPNEWASLVMIERFGVSVGTAGFGFVAFTAGMVIGRFGGDRMVDRMGAERFRRSSAAVAVVGVTLAALGPAPAVSMVGFVVTGLGAAALFPLAIRRAGELLAGSVGIAMFSSGARLGILIGPVMMGTLSDLTSRSTALLAISGLAALISVAIRLPAVTARP